MENRGSARARGYDGKWQKARGVFLAQPENQFCERCKAAGILNAGHLRMDGTPQTNPKRMHLVIDHIVPHKGDSRLFWDRSNWQVLCADHHTIAKAQEERGKLRPGVDASGRPLGRDHPWNSGA